MDRSNYWLVFICVKIFLRLYKKARTCEVVQLKHVRHLPQAKFCVSFTFPKVRATESPPYHFCVLDHPRLACESRNPLSLSIPNVLDVAVRAWVVNSLDKLTHHLFMQLFPLTRIHEHRLALVVKLSLVFRCLRCNKHHQINLGKMTARSTERGAVPIDHECV